MNRTKIILVVAAVILVGAMAFTTLFSADQHGRSITVGVLAPLTGDVGYLGEELRNSLRMHPIAQNTRVRFLYEDNKFDTPTAVSAYNKLKSQNKIDLLINLDNKTISAIAPLLARDKVITFQLFEEIEPNKEDTVFQFIYPNDPISERLGRLSSEHYKKVAVIYQSDVPIIGKNVAAFERSFRGESTRFPVRGNDDMRTTVSQALATRPDAIFVTGLHVAITNILKRMTEQARNLPPLICDPNFYLNINKILESGITQQQLEGCRSAFIDIPANKEFLEKYRTAYGSAPGIVGAYGYDMATVIEKLVKARKSDWTSELTSLKIDGVSGAIDFDENGVRTGGVYTEYIFKDGAFQKIVTFKRADD